IDTPRSCVFWGSTNDTEYLRSQHGNRRFLPIPVGRIDIEAIRRDRDQLWAEAVMIEGLDGPISLPEELWAVAAVEQEKRTKKDLWLDVLADISTAAAGYERDKIKSAKVHYDVREQPDGSRIERITSEWLIGDA